MTFIIFKCPLTNHWNKPPLIPLISYNHFRRFATCYNGLIQNEIRTDLQMKPIILLRVHPRPISEKYRLIKSQSRWVKFRVDFWIL
jgi:hypothetical protein